MRSTIAITTAFVAWAGLAQAENWTLDPAASLVSFGSIKNDFAGEIHSFGDVTGAVTGAGEVTLEIGLLSVDTGIEIRDERMVEFVFGDALNAQVTAEIDMAELEALGVGETADQEVFGTLDLLGTEVDLDANLHILRMAEDRVMVLTNGMIMLSTEDAGIDAGIDKLQEIAGLDSITRVAPVTMRLLFDKAD